jgi:SAM-dependent methyltransferase
MMKNMEEVYDLAYSESSEFNKVYSTESQNRYENLLSIIYSLKGKVNTALDIGCSYGQLVVDMNRNGIDSYGVELPISVLIESHRKSLHPSKFIYGTVNDDIFLNSLCIRSYDLICFFHTLRHIRKPERFSRLAPKYILIQEVSNNFFLRYKRKKDIQDGNFLWSPQNLLNSFPSYFVRSIYSTKFLFKIDNPNSIYLSLMNLLPTYTILLEKKL